MTVPPSSEDTRPAGARHAVPLLTLSTSERRILAGILGLCLLGRVASILLFGYTLSLDVSGYDVYAVNLLAGHGYTRFDDLHPDSDLPPLYAFFLASVYTVFGRDARAVAAAQIVFDLLTVTLIYLIGRRVFDVRAGLVAAALTAFYPYMLFQDLTANDTAIFTCLLALAVYLSYRALDASTPLTSRAIAQSPSPQRGKGTFMRRVFPSLLAGEGLGMRGLIWAALAGAMAPYYVAKAGVNALTKTLALLMLPLVALWWLRRLGWRAGLRLTLVMGLLTALVIAPWVARNIALHGRFVLISTNGGSNLYQGNNPCTAAYLRAGWDAQWTVNCLDKLPPGLTEVEADQWHTQKALAFLRADIGRALDLFFVKFLSLWSPTITPAAVPPEWVDEVGLVLQYEQPAFQAARAVHLLYFGPLLALAAVGLVLAWLRRAEVFPLVAVFLAITLTYVVYHPSTRYRMPLDPLLFVFAAYALDRLWRLWRHRRATVSDER